MSLPGLLSSGESDQLFWHHYHSVIQESFRSHYMCSIKSVLHDLQFTFLTIMQVRLDVLFSVLCHMKRISNYFSTDNWTSFWLLLIRIYVQAVYVHLVNQYMCCSVVSLSVLVPYWLYWLSWSIQHSLRSSPFHIPHAREYSHRHYSFEKITGRKNSWKKGADVGSRKTLLTTIYLFGYRLVRGAIGFQQQRRKYAPQLCHFVLTWPFLGLGDNFTK